MGAGEGRRAATVESGAFAAAKEPRGEGRAAAGGRKKSELVEGHFAETTCLNCSAALKGAFCHQCGQTAHLHRTTGAFLHDLLHGALHFEGRTWATLPKLIVRPGELTRRYIEGERKRFVSPMALFLFSIFLMFAVFQTIGISTPTDIDPDDPIEVRNTLDAAKAEARADITQQRVRIAAMTPDDPDRSTGIARLEELETTYEAIERTEAFSLDEPVEGGAQDRTGIAFIDAGIEKWRTNPGLMLYKLQASGYKFSWLLIPISAPFVWLLFAWKRQFRLYDHAIFVTYSIGFMSLFFIVLSILIKIGAPEWIWGTMLALVPPIHIYKHLRGTYALSRFSAGWRLAVLLFFINLVAVVFFNLLLVIGAF